MFFVFHFHWKKAPIICKYYQRRIQGCCNIQDEALCDLVPVIWKIIGNVVHDQANAFLSDENILYSYQSDYRANHSTDLGLPIFRKLAKLANLKICYKSLKQLNSQRETIQWFRSYLSERICLVNTERKLLDIGKTSSRVPKGSLLGPPLFLIYVNDTP